jgi:flavin-binding protein dodecin
MSDHVYKVIELAGTSSVSVEEAVNGAIARASKTIRNMRWFQVIETRGSIDGGKVSEWQVSIKVGFTLDSK